MMGLNVKESLVVLKRPERGRFLLPREKLQKKRKQNKKIANKNTKSLVEMLIFQPNSYIINLVQTSVWSSLASGSSSSCVKPTLFLCFSGLVSGSSMLMVTASLLESSRLLASSNSVDMIWVQKLIKMGENYTV